MDLNTAIQCALEGNALLFAGSGFSYGAKNIENEGLKVGNELRDIISRDCNVGSDRDISIVSQYHIKHNNNNPEKLIDLLKRQFSITSVASWHKVIMSINWKRIYTTNYDSVIEDAAKNNSKHITPIVLSECLQDCNLSEICVHLNGFIDNLDKNTIFNEFKLIDRSYSCDNLVGNEWFELFISDLDSAQAIIIVGYSMQFDLDIKRLLASPKIKEKVLFIDKPDPDPIDESLLLDYGNCEFIGVDGFAQKIEEINENFIPSIYFEYKTFIHEFRKTIVPSSVSFETLIKLYSQGSMCDALLQKKYGEYKYIILRNAYSVFERNIDVKKVFLVLSSLGNGKTMFCNIIRNELSNRDIDVFTFKHEYNDYDKEIMRIVNNQRRSIVIFDDYKSHVRILEKFKYYSKNKNITFVLTARNSVNPSHRVITNSLQIEDSEIMPIYLDILGDYEIDQLSQIIQRNKLYSSKVESYEDFLRVECNSRFADVLLKIYNSSDIKARIKANWDNFDKSKKDIIHLVVFALMKSVMGIDFELNEMLSLIRIDYTMLSIKDEEFIKEFFDFSENDVKIKSSVVARELLRFVIGLDVLLDTMKLAVEEADKRYKANNSFVELLKKLISHSNFRIFEPNEDNKNKINLFYDSIRNLSFCKDNTFYWEQFASACLETKHFDVANQCIENAFSIAKRIPSFIPFHIENIKANCMIEELLYNNLTNKSIAPDEIVSVICDAHNRLLKHFSHPENRISYVFRVGAKYERVYSMFETLFDKRHKSIITEKCVEMVRLMEQHQYDFDLQNSDIKKWIYLLQQCIAKCKNY